MRDVRHETGDLPQHVGLSRAGPKPVGGRKLQGLKGWHVSLGVFRVV